MYSLISASSIHRIKMACSDLVNRLVLLANHEGYLTVSMELVGSNASNLVAVDGSKPINLEYNLVIDAIKGDIDDCAQIYEYVSTKFKSVLEALKWGDMKDTELAMVTDTHSLNSDDYKVSLSILTRKDGIIYRMVYDKKAKGDESKCYWLEVVDSKDLGERALYLKQHEKYEEIKDEYLRIKNHYLKNKDKTHTSLDCYIEAVNSIYSKSL